MENFRSQSRQPNRSKSSKGRRGSANGSGDFRGGPNSPEDRKNGWNPQRGRGPRGGRGAGRRGRGMRGRGSYSRQSGHTENQQRDGNWARVDGDKRLAHEAEDLSAREQGKVVLVKEQYGFIRHIERDRGDVFFHLSEAPQGVEVGSEVEFAVRKNRNNGPGAGKPSAVGLKLLPPGTLQFEEVLDGRFIGRIEKDLRGNSAGRGSIYSSRRPSFGNAAGEGCIRLMKLEGGEAVDQSGPGELLPFKQEDLVAQENEAPPRLLKGDDVELTLVVDKSTGKKRAKDITLHRTARQRREDEAIKQMEKSGEPKEKGTIQRIKDDFGFIRGLIGEKDIFFRLADVDASLEGLQLVEGLEVEYYVLSDQARGRDSVKAAKIKVLPSGTLEKESRVEGLAGKITQRPRGEQLPGYIQMEFTDISQLPQSLQKIVHTVEYSDGEEKRNLQAYVEVPFWQENVTTTCRLVPDDLVLLDLVIDRYEGWIGTNCHLLGLADFGREEGVITNCCDNYGFIRCCRRTIDLYFSYNELVNPTIAFQEGTEVRFDVVEHQDHGDARARASRVEVLPPGTIWFDKKLAEGIRGVVHREPKGTGIGVVKCPSALAELPEGLSEEEYPELAKQIEDFRADDSRQELWLEPTLSSQERRAVHEIAARKGLGHENQEIRKDNKLQGEAPDKPGEEETDSGDGQKQEKVLKTLKIWKLKTPEEVQAWDIAEKAHQATLAAEEMSFTFIRDDLRNHKQAARKGAEVTFDIVFDRRQKRRVARNLLVVAQPATPAGDELGVIVSIQEDRHFGFIEWASAQVSRESRRIFFHLSEMERDDPAEGPATLGQEVAFSVQHRKGQPTAVNVRRVPKGTVQMESEQILYGLVALLPEEEPAAKEGEVQDHELLEGKLVALDLVKTADDTNSNGMKLVKRFQVLSFTAEDIQKDEKGALPVLSRGACVIFSVVFSGASRTKTIRNLRLPKEGEVSFSSVPPTQAKVTKVDPEAGIAYLQPEVPMGMSLSFKFQDVVGYFGPVRSGEMVDCLPLPPQDPECKSISAIGVVRLKDLNGGRRKRAGVNTALKRALRKKGIQAQPHFIMAKGPDGSKGFKAGWRSIPNPTTDLTENSDEQVDSKTHGEKNGNALPPSSTISVADLESTLNLEEPRKEEKNVASVVDLESSLNLDEPQKEKNVASVVDLESSLNLDKPQKEKNVASVVDLESSLNLDEPQKEEKSVAALEDTN